VTTVTSPARPAVVIPATAGATTPENPWPVRLLTAKLTEYIAKAPGVWLEGQVVQLTRRPGQGTVYLTLRDTDVDLSFSVTVAAKILDGLAAPLADGAHVVVHARPQLFPRRGSLTLNADDLRPVGIGELLARLEHLRRVLAAEGLFALDRKQPLPFLPRVVGLVSGRASAAERDVVENARRRLPGARFRLENVAMQGTNAVAEVVEALRRLDGDPEVDVIVIARGGGGVEDLLPFSNETLVRAVSDAFTPIVSAIGHETDRPLLDLVADVAASTPTDAAKRIVPDLADELRGVAELRARARACIRTRIDRETELMTGLPERLRRTLRTRLEREGTEAAGLRARSRQRLSGLLEGARSDLAHVRARVRTLSPQATLDRGYAVVRRDDGSVVRTPADAIGALRIRVAGGEFGATASDR
jgi:exodeoxyribonuclease VII large subunit